MIDNGAEVMLNDFEKLLFRLLEEYHDFDFSKPIVLSEAQRLIGFVSSFDKDNYIESKHFDVKLCQAAKPRILFELNNAISNVMPDQGISVASK